MKRSIYCRILILFLFIIGCSSIQNNKEDVRVDSRFITFWKEFQNAVAKNDKAKVSEMTLFPLSGSDFVAERYDGKGLSKEEFIKYYENIFDQEVKNIIKKDAFQLINSGVLSIRKHDSQKTYVLEVLYDWGDGTESMTIFSFAEKENEYKLVNLIGAD